MSSHSSVVIIDPQHSFSSIADDQFLLATFSFPDDSYLEAMIEFLLGSPHGQHFTTIIFRKEQSQIVGVTDASAERIARIIAEHPSVVRIDIEPNTLTVEGIKTIIAALPKLTKLEDLIFDASNWNLDTAKAALEAVKKLPQGTPFKRIGACTTRDSIDDFGAFEEVCKEIHETLRAKNRDT